ncbi:exopolysaccharide biosynthesis polyprenyl glycosylphosphotransferase [Brevundimonas sp.]|uniref:exopolysaccharide biosynthesis polyprenyl glycosylphosphotransferase n=1 Tax=Brevundimonas sp. TaxID=1871086 RepID=UPI003BA9B2FE
MSITHDLRLSSGPDTPLAPSPAPAAPKILAAEVIEPSAAAIEDASATARRGPFRPDVWLNARQRRSARLVVHYFRAADVAAVILTSLACGWFTARDASVSAMPLYQVLPFVAGAMAVLGLTRSLGLYRFSRDEPAGRHLAKLGGIALVSGLIALALGGLLGGSQVETEALAVWAGLVLVVLSGLHLAWSGVVARWRANGALTPNIVVVGATKNAERLIRDALARRDLNVLGVFDDRLARSPDSIDGVPVLGDAAALLTHKMTPYIDRIVVAIDPRAEARVRELTSRLQTLPNEVTLLVDPHGQAERVAALDKLARAPLASLDGMDDDRRAFNKRVQDIVVACIATVLLAPVMAVCALAIRLDSPGPIFFRQRRHGFNQEEIVVWKFRSMRTEAADATASRQVTADDDRVTRVGRILRSTSLDELPQLLNVLTGEMSLVGPRPHAIGMKTGHVESALLVADYAHRHRIKPGMTGWAAVQGSRGPLHTAQDVRRRVQLDIDYVERHSLWLDLWIMAVTVPVLLGDRQAIR